MDPEDSDILLLLRNSITPWKEEEEEEREKKLSRSEATLQLFIFLNASRVKTKTACDVVMHPGLSLRFGSLHFDSYYPLTICHVAGSLNVSYY